MLQSRTILNTAVALAAIAFFAVTLPSSNAQNRSGIAGPLFDLSWNTIDCGGGSSPGGAFELAGTIAQHDAAIMTGGTFELLGGFWPGALGAQVIPCPADIGPTPGGDGEVNVSDLLIVINSWGTCPVPPNNCPADIAPPGGDGFVAVDDLLAVINGWGACP